MNECTPIAMINDPHGGQEISAVTWSHNNMILATCGQNSCSVTLSRTSDGIEIQKLDLCARGVSVTDIAFSSQSIYIAFGCDDNTVGIINVRSKSLVVMM